MKKFKFIKLLGFAPLVTVPLIAAGCNGGTNNPPANQKTIGDYMMKNIVARLANKENYDIYGKNPESVIVYQAGTTKALDSASAYNFVNTNGNRVIKDGTTTYTFKGNTGSLTTESIIPFATVAFEKELINISISFTIIVSDNKVDTTKSKVAIDSSSSAVEFYSYLVGNTEDLPDSTQLAAFFATKNLVNVFNWMYKTKEDTASLAGGATDKDGVVKFPITEIDNAKEVNVNLPKGQILPTTPATPPVKALTENYIAFGEITYNAGPKKQGIISIAKISTFGIDNYSGAYYFKNL